MPRFLQRHWEIQDPRYRRGVRSALGEQSSRQNGQDSSSTGRPHSLVAPAPPSHPQSPRPVPWSRLTPNQPRPPASFPGRARASLSSPIALSRSLVAPAPPSHPQSPSPVPWSRPHFPLTSNHPRLPASLPSPPPRLPHPQSPHLTT